MLERSTQHRRRSRAITRWTRFGCWAVTVLIVSAPLYGGDDEKRRTEDDSRRGIAIRLDDARLSPRVSLAMESLTTFESVAGPGTSLEHHVLYDEMTDSIRRGAERVTRKALKNYLLNSLRIDQGIDNVRQGVRGAPSTSTSTSSRWRYQFGVHSLSPEVAVRYRMKQNSVRFKLNAEGEMGVRVNTSRFEGASVNAWYDGDRLEIGASLGF